MTPRVKQQLLEKVAEDDYRASAKSVQVMGNTISAATTGRVLLEAGRELHTELFGPEAALKAAKEAPRNPVALLLLSSDGSRYRTNEADKKKAVVGGTPEAAPVQDELDVEALTVAERDRGWRENKIGILARALPGRYDGQGHYLPPEELVKTYVATTANIEQFGQCFRTEAERRGLENATVVVWTGDHGHGNPTMLQREFGKLKKPLNIITDFYHCSERLAECAKIIEGEGSACKRKRQKRYHQFRSWLWDGKVKTVIEKLVAEAEALAPRPPTLKALENQPAARTLWLHVFYFEKHQETMDYPTYRDKGWPMGSGTIESSCGQFGERVKHNRMRWTRDGCDALHAVKAAILSEDGRWSRRWPPPVPVLPVSAWN
jgi:hypothetical protein